MVEVVQLTRPKIRRQVGDASLHKAKSYLSRGVWSDLRAQGPTIKGRCRGQGPQPYRVEVTFEGNVIAAADCSCPVGGGGHCKHVAALLLYYREHPDAFVDVEELDAALERRGKGELIALIRRMIRRVPELELLLESPLPGYVNGAADDPEPFRRQARAAFDRGGSGWGAAAAVARELEDIVGAGDEFRAGGSIAAAAAVYRGVADVVIEHLFSVADEDGDLLEVLSACAAGLCSCLEALPPDDSRRDDLLRALVELFVADEAHGGLGVSDSIPEAILHRTTPEERRRVAGWVRDRLPRGDSWSDEFQRRELGSFLLDLEADALDDEAFLRLCRETGRSQELVERFLVLGGVHEALRTVRAADDAELPALADLLAQHAHVQEAEWVVEDRAGKSHETVLIEWLKRQALARRDRAAALKWAEKAFHRLPSLHEYSEIRRLTGAKEWPQRREKLLAELEKDHNAWLLVEIYLHEHDVTRALAVVKAPWGRHTAQRLDVARAAEKEFPREALALYRQAAEGLIESRGREAYRLACGHLRKVRDLYDRLDENSAWEAYLANLREGYRALRAFREELEHSKLK